MAVAVVALMAAGALAGLVAPAPADGPITMEAGRTAVAFYPERIVLSPSSVGAPDQIELDFADTPPVRPLQGQGGGVTYPGLWGGVDLRYDATPLGPKYELVVPPSVPLEAVALRASSSTAVSLAADGRLELRAGAFQVTDSPLVAWDASGESVDCAYDLRAGGVIGFACPGWSRESALTIDPLLLSTFIGGAQRDEAHAVATDPNGNLVVVGWTSSDDFPITAFSPDQDATGGDAFVAKFSPDGTGLLFATYLGGTGFEVAFAVACSSNGTIWVVGQTNSPDFDTTPNAFQPNASGGMDAFLVRLSEDGTVVEYATYFGGSGWDRALGLSLFQGSTPVITGETNSSAFPTTEGPALQNGSGPFDAFAATFNQNTGALHFSELIGGNGSDSGRAIATTADGGVIIAGSTNSSDLMAVGPGADFTLDGGSDAFVAYLNPLGGLSGLTYLGGSGDDFAFTLALDAAGSPFVGGLSGSPDFPATVGAFGSSPGGSEDGFVAKMRANGTGLLASTYVGGDGSDGVVALAVGVDGSITAVGFTDSIDFPVTVGAMRTTRSGTAFTSFQEAYFARMSGDLSTLHYSSYMGEDGADIARGVVVDATGYATVVGATDAFGFPTTQNAMDRTLNSTEAFLFRAFQRRPTLAISTDPPSRPYSVNGTMYTAATSAPCSEGVPLPIQIASPQVGSGVRHLFANWSDGGTQNRTMQCLFDESVEARFTKEFLASITTDPGGLWLLVDGLNETTPWSAWWTPGSAHTAEAPAVHSRNGTRYILNGWTDGGPASRVVTAAGPITIVARYAADAYSFEIVSDPPGRTAAVDGVNFVCPAALWMAIGSTHLLSAPTPQPASAGLRYAFTDWSESWANDGLSYTAQGPGGITVTFTAEFEIRLDSDPPGFPVAVDFTETTMPWSGWRLNGTGISIAPPAAPPERAGVQYGAMSWSDGGAPARLWSVWRPETLVALFQPVAFEVRLESNPPGVPLSLDGSAVGAESSFQAPNTQLSIGAPVNFTNGSIRYTFLRWSDAGDRTHFMTVVEPVTLTAFFSREFEVRFAATPGDALFRVDGNGYVGAAALWMEEGSVHTLVAAQVVPGGTGRRLSFVSWGVGESATQVFTADAPALVNLTYRAEVLLTVESSGGDPSCDVPTCWYPVGSTATVTVRSPWNDTAGRREVLRGWLGNESSSGLSAEVSMEGPEAVTVLWGVQYYLTVTSKYGLAAGSGWYDEGAGASFNVSATEATAGGVRYRFAGWSGDQLSTGPDGLVFMDGPKSVVAVWEEVRAAPTEAPLWLLALLIPAAGAALAAVVFRRRAKARQVERLWNKRDEFEPVHEPGKR